MTYKPMFYGSPDYQALRRSVVTRRSRTSVAGTPVVVEHQHAARPGLWSFDGADLFTVLKASPAIRGLSSNVSEVVAYGTTRKEALAAARVKLGGGK